MKPVTMKLFRSWLFAALAMGVPAASASAHIGINSPNGGETFTVGEEVTIEWVVQIAHNTSNWDVWYSNTMGPPWQPWSMDIPTVGSIAVGTIHTTTLTILPEQVGTTFRIRVRMDNDPSGATDYFDVTDTAITVVAGPWDNLGFALAGTNGLATFVGTGDLTGGSLNRIDLENAQQSTLAVLFLGLAAGNAPFKGGTLVPVPVLLTVSFTTDASGSIPVPFIWPTGLPSGIAFYFHYWFSDPAGPAGVAASNALKGTTP
jgi:hypothetical protein